MMKLLDWLLSQTPNGATWLQAIITIFLLCLVVCLFYYSMTDSSDDIKKGDETINEANN